MPDNQWSAKFYYGTDVRASAAGAGFYEEDDRNKRVMMVVNGNHCASGVMFVAEVMQQAYKRHVRVGIEAEARTVTVGCFTCLTTSGVNGWCAHIVAVVLRRDLIVDQQLELAEITNVQMVSRAVVGVHKCS